MSEPMPESRREFSAGREHSLESLLELGRELTVSLGVHETADLVLFNLMGQLRTSRSALWLLPDEEGDRQPVLVRGHGFRRSVLEALGPACGPALLERFGKDGAPALSWALAEGLGAGPFELMRHAAIAIVAPLHARDEVLGWLALGERVDASPYTEDDLRVLEAALGMVAVSLQNARLYNRSREMNRRLRSANEHLSELDRLKNDFLSNVNHELRTPLAVVMGSLECVVDHGSADPQVKGLLDASLAQSRKLYGLIENLLAFSEASNSKLEVRNVPDDLAAVAEACCGERSPGVTAGLRELQFRRAQDLPRAVFDRARVLQVLNELIDNAVKFTPRGARIEVAVEIAREPERTWVQVEVHDNGRGIDPRRLHTVFTSFEQIDGSATRRVGGLGMGLALAHRLAACMGGTLSAESEVGRGLTIRLRLPACAPTIVDRPPPSSD